MSSGMHVGFVIVPELEPDAIKMMKPDLLSTQIKQTGPGVWNCHPEASLFRVQS